MKKTAVSLFFLLCLVNFSPISVSASEDLKKPSRFYFLQTWMENIRLSLNFSNEKKLSYLFALTDKRVTEMENSSSPALTRLYEKHYQYLDKLASQMENKNEVAARIRENNLRQQEVLAKVYEQVPESAKTGIINAQENSSKHVAKVVERVEGAQNAEEYLQMVTAIQQLEKLGQIELLEQAPLESAPNADPSQNTPKNLQESKGLLPGQGQNPLNSALENQGGNNGSQMEPATPAEKNQTMGL